MLVHQSIQTAARNAAANKQVMADAQTTRLRTLKRYTPKRMQEEAQDE